MPAMKDKRHYLSACTVNDECIYAFGGFFGSTEQEINDSIEMFDVEKNIWQVLSVRMKVSWHVLVSSLSLESAMGLLCSCNFSNRDNSDRRQEHQQERWSASFQREYKELEESAQHEPATRISQELPLLEQDLRYWRWLRHELRSIRHPREQVEFYLVVQCTPREFTIFVLIGYCYCRRRTVKYIKLAGARALNISC